MTHYTGVSSFGLKSNFKLEVLWKVSASDIILFFSHLEWLKFRYYEKAIKIWKNLPPVLTKQLFLLSSVKARRYFFKFLWPFQKSWTLNVAEHYRVFSFLYYLQINPISMSLNNLVLFLLPTLEKSMFCFWKSIRNKLKKGTKIQIT